MVATTPLATVTQTGLAWKQVEEVRKQEEGGGAANEGGVAKRTANLFVSDKDSLYYMEYAD